MQLRADRPVRRTSVGLAECSGSIDRSCPGTGVRERSARSSASTQRGAEGRICRICSAAGSGRDQIRAAPRRGAGPGVCADSAFGGPPARSGPVRTAGRPGQPGSSAAAPGPQPSHGASVTEQTSWPSLSNPAAAAGGGLGWRPAAVRRTLQSLGLRWLRVSTPGLIGKTCLSACKLGYPEPGGSAWV